MSKDQWIAEHERIIQAFVDEDISRDEAIAQLVELGFRKSDAGLEIDRAAE